MHGLKELIEEVSRDGRIKKYMNKSYRDDNKQNASSFIETVVENNM